MSAPTPAEIIRVVTCLMLVAIGCWFAVAHPPAIAWVAVALIALTTLAFHGAAGVLDVILRDRD